MKKGTLICTSLIRLSFYMLYLFFPLLDYFEPIICFSTGFCHLFIRVQNTFWMLRPCLFQVLKMLFSQDVPVFWLFQTDSSMALPAQLHAVRLHKLGAGWHKLAEHTAILCKDLLMNHYSVSVKLCPFCFQLRY